MNAVHTTKPETTFNKLSKFSSKVKTENNEIDNFLDNINELKKIIRKKSDRLEKIVNFLEKQTWFNLERDPEDLHYLNSILSFLKEDYESSLITLDLLKENCFNIAPTEINRFEMAINDFKEISNDYEDVFLNLPKDKEFNLANNRLQNL